LRDVGAVTDSSEFPPRFKNSISNSPKIVGLLAVSSEYRSLWGESTGGLSKSEEFRVFQDR
jgi:hypothetical protein